MIKNLLHSRVGVVAPGFIQQTGSLASPSTLINGGQGHE